MKVRNILWVFAIIMLLIGLSACSLFNAGQSTDNSIEITCYLSTTAEAPTMVKAVDGNLHLQSLPTRTGYTFQGLYDAPQGGSMVVDANGHTLVVIDRAMTLYAQWTAKDYHIVFDSQGGEISSDEVEMTVTYGETVVRFPAATKEGHNFVGWEDVNGNRYSSGTSILREKQSFNADNYVLDGDVVRLYAVYEIAKYSVVFNYNDGTYRTAEIMVEYGQSILEDQYPTEGTDSGSSRVSGWALSADGTQPFMGTVKSNMTLYAIWKDYKTFTLNDTVGNETKIYVYRGETFDLQGFDGVTRPGYDLEGWYTSGVYSGNPVTKIAYDASESVYYAKWNLATYTILFDIETAGVSVPAITYQMGDRKELAIIEKNGYTFLGWATTNAQDSYTFTVLPDTLYGNMTLYAVFAPCKYTVALSCDSELLAGKPNAVEVTYGKSYQLPVLSKDGVVFDGWYDGEGDNAHRMTDENGKAIEGYHIADHVTLYPHWSPIKYQVSFNTNGGGQIKTQTVIHNQPLVLPEEPTKTGMIFDGWYNEDLTESYYDGFLVTKDLVLQAKWVQSRPISTVDELRAISANPDVNYHLTKDINLGGAEWTMIPEFKGVLNGKGYKIYNFSINGTEINNGFFGISTGEIKNVTFADFSFAANLTRAHNSAVIVGRNLGTIQNCSVIDGSMVFGINISYESASGYLEVVSAHGVLSGVNEGTISGCHTDVKISGIYKAYRDEWFNDKEILYNAVYSGGAVGINSGTLRDTITSVHMDAKLDATRSRYCTVYTDIYFGGIIGVNHGLTERCSAEMNAVCTSEGNSLRQSIIGGCVGRNAGGTINESYARGTISTVPEVSFHLIYHGGFVGQNIDGGKVNNCYATVSIEQHASASICYIGGFVGENKSNVTNCYAFGNIILTNAPAAASGGLVGSNQSGGIVSKSFCDVNMSVTTSENKGYLVGEIHSGSSTHKCYYSYDSHYTVNGTASLPNVFEGTSLFKEELQSIDFIYDTLAWGSDVWRIPADGYPVLVWQD